MRNILLEIGVYYQVQVFIELHRLKLTHTNEFHIHTHIQYTINIYILKFDDTVVNRPSKIIVEEAVEIEKFSDFKGKFL